MVSQRVIRFDINPDLFNNIFWHLREAFKNPLIRFIWAYGGSSASKTYSIVQAIITELLESNSNTLVLRKYSTDIKDSIFADFKGIISKWELNEYFTIQQNFIKCNLTGSYVRFRGLDDSEKVKGISGFKRVIMEEISQFEHEDFKQVKKRLRGLEGQQVICIFNPISKEHWIKKEVFDKEEWKEVESDITGKFYNEKGNTLLLKTTYRDNKYIVGPHYVDQHVIDDFEWDKVNDPASYDVYANGNWGELKTKNPFATQFSSKHESKDAVFVPGRQITISIDFNLNPFGVIFSHEWFDKEGHHCHVFDEASIENGSIQKMIEHIKLKYGRYLSNCRITGDSMGKRRDMGQPDLASFYDQLQRGLGLRDKQLHLPNNPTHINSRGDVNYVLAHLDIKIHPNCQNLIRDLKVVECDAFGEILKKDRNNLNQLADHLDCFRYLVNTFLWDWIQNHQKGKIRH